MGRAVSPFPVVAQALVVNPCKREVYYWRVGVFNFLISNWTSGRVIIGPVNTRPFGSRMDPDRGDTPNRSQPFSLMVILIRAVAEHHSD